MTRQMSVGQRMAIGFGALLALFAAFAVLVASWNRDSVRAQSNYQQRIAPLIERTANLERAMLQVAVGGRGYFLNPVPERLAAYSETLERTRMDLERLGQIPMEPETRETYEQITARTERYLTEINRLIERRVQGAPVSETDERDVAELRELALASVRRLSDLQTDKAARALQEMARARDKLSVGLVVAAVIGSIVFLIVAYATTQSVRRPAHELARVAEALEAGNWQPARQLYGEVIALEKRFGARRRSEMRMLARAIGSAAVVLERREQRLRADNEIAQAAASTLERERLAALALRPIVESAGAQVGVIYWLAPGSELLEPVARHALARDLPPVRIGEGIPGQAAQERRQLVLRDIPPDSGFTVKIGYDEALPRTVAALPILFRHTLHGVLLVASLRDIDEDTLDFLAHAATQLGIGMQNVSAFEEVQRLLTDLHERNQRIQAQNEQLQAQNEEIQLQNEEIQSQSEELQAQAAELQAQSAQIQRQNEELRAHQEELERQANLLKEADERKNQFLGVLAHELRNPMAPISNSLVILKRMQPGTEQAIRAQAVIERQTRHLIRLIDDLLDVTRISQGKIRINRTRVDLTEVARSCVEDLRGALEDAGVGIDVNLPDGPLWIAGDYTRLSQVLGNLLNNSIKFTDRGGRISLKLTVNADRRAELTVADNGIGIAQELLPKLFQPFSQGIDTIARSAGGLGLGLALVKALVELHDGTVTAHSDGPNKGARFTVTLPLDVDVRASA